MKQLILVVGIAVALSCLLVFAKTRHASGRPITSGYTMTMQVVENGKVIANVRRQVKSNGEFLEETDHLNSDGSIRKQTKSAGTLRGALAIDDANQRLTFFGGAGLIHPVSESELKAQKDFNREDNLLGFKVIVQKTCDIVKRCTEYWVAPELGSDDVKIDIVDGEEGNRLIKEATSILRQEPLFQIPNYPVVQSPRVANPAKF